MTCYNFAIKIKNRIFLHFTQKQSLKHIVQCMYDTFDNILNPTTVANGLKRTKIT